MNTLGKPDDAMQIVSPDWHEAFPEPQTIPSGWDLSGVLAPTAGLFVPATTASDSKNPEADQ